MTRTEMICNELKKRLQASGFKPIEITMKVNHDLIVITPCWMGIGEPPSFEQVEFYMMDSQKLNLCGSEKLEHVADTIARYDELLEEDAKALESLKAYICKYDENSDWDFVSDYHKDIFGHRPHVPHSQIIAWAHSNSKGSARFFG